MGMIRHFVHEIIDSVKHRKKRYDTIRYYHHHHYETIKSVKKIKRQRNYVVDGKMKLFNAILVALFVVVDIVFVVVVDNISNRK